MSEREERIIGRLVSGGVIGLLLYAAGMIVWAVVKLA